MLSPVRLEGGAVGQVDPGQRDAQRRAAAIVALIGLALALFAVLAFALGDLVHLVVSLLGVALAVTGGWYAVANRGIVRRSAVLLAAAGLLVALIGLLAAGTDLWALALAGLLMALSVISAQYATRRRAGSVVAADLAAPHPPARHPVLIMNRRSGGGKVDRFHLVEQCRERGIEPVILTPGDDLVALAEDAIARGADVIGMAGGDGSQALVASVAARHGVPHVVVPAGTRNHLALDLGLDRDDVVGALAAFSGGIPRTIDLATVNGRVFVNNASMGLYAEIVASEAYRDAKLQTALDTLPDLLGADTGSANLRFVDGEGNVRDRADVVLVSNNPYVLDSLGGVGTRERMDTGTLGMVAVTVRSAVEARRFLALEAAGKVSRFAGWQQWAAPRFRVDSEGPVPIGVDGEALTMDPPIVFEIHPAALTVLLPPDAPGRSPAARRVTRNTARELWQVALGRG
jgi:diacylglycerol kinase family enzyme